MDRLNSKRGAEFTLFIVASRQTMPFGEGNQPRRRKCSRFRDPIEEKYHHERQSNASLQDKEAWTREQESV
jgi:hypothetical protein